MKSKRTIIVVVLILAFLIMIGIFLKHHCPAEGIAFTRERRVAQRLKNRTVPPRPEEFDTRATLQSLLQPGADQTRWSDTSAARIEGYVVAVASAHAELANCYLPCRRDIHINLALRPDAPLREQLVVEITPRVTTLAQQKGEDWSETTLQKELLGHWCSFEGWLFFDAAHAEESENISPGRVENWRGTAWEVHPVTNFKVKE